MVVEYNIHCTAGKGHINNLYILLSWQSFSKVSLGAMETDAAAFQCVFIVTSFDWRLIVRAEHALQIFKPAQKELDN